MGYESQRKHQRYRLSSEDYEKISQYDKLLEEVTKLRAENVHLRLVLGKHFPSHHGQRNLMAEVKTEIQE